MRGRSWVAAVAMALAIAGVLYLALPFRAGVDGGIRCGALALWIVNIGVQPEVVPGENSAYREFNACQDAARPRLAGAAAALVAAAALGLVARRGRALGDHGRDGSLHDVVDLYAEARFP